ncbi:MAG TPA: hypothetical protein VF476_04510 [Chitinophagaceae bacterium]
MKKSTILSFLLLVSCLCVAQKDTSKWVRAFPITNYTVELNDSVRLVQLYLPVGPVIKEKQVGILKGVYQASHADTSTIGSGRCNLIKGDYYYFSINHKKTDRQPKENDLLYVLVDKPAIYYDHIAFVASHFIELQNVYEEPLFDRLDIFQSWSAANEQTCIDSMKNDIHFTGDYFLKNNPSMNVKISAGKYAGKTVFNVMIQSTKEDVKDFLDYMIVRPRLYAGRKWKISEIFATWLSEGAPTVIKR